MNLKEGRSHEEEISGKPSVVGFSETFVPLDPYTRRVEYVCESTKHDFYFEKIIDKQIIYFINIKIMYYFTRKIEVLRKSNLHKRLLTCL